MKKKVYFLIMVLICIVVPIITFPKIHLYYTGYKCKKELYKMNSIIDVSDSTFEGLSLLNTDLHNNDIFLSGEKHGSVKSIQMNLYLLKYFVEKENIKYILYEGGYANAEYLNTYLDTGDEAIIEYLFYNSTNTLNYTMENYDLLKEIYEYNLTLPKYKKLKFVGIDLETPSVAIKYINSLIPDSMPNNEIVQEFIYSIKMISKGNYLTESKKSIELLNQGEKDIKEYFSENFFSLSFALKNLSISDNQLSRENMLIDNFITLHEHLPKGKFFGQFGGAHTNLSILSESLASYLQNIYEPTKGRVISIEFDYVNSYTYVPNVPSLDINPTIYTSTSPDFFLKDESTALIKLNYENSIYNEKDIFLNPNNPQTAYFQYLIMFSDSSSATRWSLLQ
ncbi:hypothetical protein [Clostridium algidicarnis]|uniref:hypothetical protein n=1 Tax=Clostridium algidicarnis TaxID=37659 RepID=UPI000495CEEC|nr:hypothetical protein [Clostridium algidicarnis]